MVFRGGILMEKLDQAKLIDDVNKTGRNVNTIDDLIKMGPNDKDLIPIYQAGSEKRVKEIGEGKIKRISYPLFRKESTKYTRNVSAVATLTPRQVERYRLRPCGRRKIDAMPSFIENLMLIIE